jgi:hypothetical protein
MSKATKDGKKVNIGRRRSARLSLNGDRNYAGCQRKILSRPGKTTEDGWRSHKGSRAARR